MANGNPSIVFGYEVLTALSARLRDHAEDISASIEFEPIARDLRLAATALSRFASLQFRIAELADTADTFDLRYELHQALHQAQQG